MAAADKWKRSRYLGVKHSSEVLVLLPAMPPVTAWWRCGSWQWDGPRWLRITLPACGAAGETACEENGGGSQWNWTLCCQTLTEVSHRTAGEPWGNQGKTIWRLGYRIHSLSAPSCSSRAVIHYFICILSLYSFCCLRLTDNSNFRKICSISVITAMKAYLCFWNGAEMDIVFAY